MRTSNPASRARPASSDARPSLADARISDDENGPTTSSPGRVENTLELSKLTDASYEDVARGEPPFEPVSRSPPSTGRALIRTRASRDTQAEGGE